MIFKSILVFCLIITIKAISDIASEIHLLTREIERLPRSFGKQFENLKVNVNYNEVNNDQTR